MYCLVGATALLVYDYFHLLPLEVSLVWPAPWNSFGKGLFFLTRYLVFADVGVIAASAPVHFIYSTRALIA